MDKTRKHLISLAVLTAISAIVPTATFAQLHLEIAKAPEQAPKIAIIRTKATIFIKRSSNRTK